MIRLIFLSFLAHSLARINPAKLHNLGINECDLVPKISNGYTEDTDTHYFFGADGSVADASHFFALLHCSLPLVNRTFAHPIPLIGNNESSYEICKISRHSTSSINESATFKVRDTVSDENLRHSNATIPSLCQFIHFTPHPSNTVILLFMEPFLCHVSNPHESTFRRVVFIQTTREQSVEITADRIQVYNLNLDALYYVASIHSIAYDIIGRVSPRIDAYSVSFLSEYSEEYDPSAHLLLIVAVSILPISVFFVLLAYYFFTLDVVNEYYAKMAAEWYERQESIERRRRITLYERLEQARFLLELDSDKVEFVSETLGEEVCQTVLTIKNPQQETYLFGMYGTGDHMFITPTPKGYIKPGVAQAVKLKFTYARVPDSGEHYIAVHCLKVDNDEEPPESAWDGKEPEAIKILNVYFRKEKKEEEKEEEKKEETALSSPLSVLSVPSTPIIAQEESGEEPVSRDSTGLDWTEYTLGE